MIQQYSVTETRLERRLRHGTEWCCWLTVPDATFGSANVLAQAHRINEALSRAYDIHAEHYAAFEEAEFRCVSSTKTITTGHQLADGWHNE